MLQVLSSTNPNVFENSGEEVCTFFAHSRELLKICEVKSMTGWKLVELMTHLSAVGREPLNHLKRLNLLPILAPYATGPIPDPEKSAAILSLIERLSDGYVVDDSGSWLRGLVADLSNRILEKNSETLAQSVAILSNLCLDSIGADTLRRDKRYDELLTYLFHLTDLNNPHLTQLHICHVSNIA